jgi:hypothetical protein
LLKLRAIPQGYKIQQTKDLIYLGLCPHCNKKKISFIKEYGSVANSSLYLLGPLDL